MVMAMAVWWCGWGDSHDNNSDDDDDDNCHPHLGNELPAQHSEVRRLLQGGTAQLGAVLRGTQQERHARQRSRQTLQHAQEQLVRDATLRLRLHVATTAAAVTTTPVACGRDGSTHKGVVRGGVVTAQTLLDVVEQQRDLRDAH
jgi:hypothetical protein